MRKYIHIHIYLCRSLSCTLSSSACCDRALFKGGIVSEMRMGNLITFSLTGWAADIPDLFDDDLDTTTPT
jgi:hypothetical protein